MHNTQSILEHALEVARLARPLVEAIQRRDRDLASQVKRAINSVALSGAYLVKRERTRLRRGTTEQDGLERGPGQWRGNRKEGTPFSLTPSNAHRLCSTIASWADFPNDRTRTPLAISYWRGDSQPCYAFRPPKHAGDAGLGVGSRRSNAHR